ncbi:uncharacterized protein LOC142327116 isoform X3 [Lycorma delicatula]|uniref:uncharacterized protein LOC142327116 isoform X3 n=1 Tax=Lycorma delicatula TaxID=130591 RepID=UPI003F518D41
MTAEQFCLRWNNHQSTLVSVFDGLFESGTLVDCTLAADGQYLKAHKVVLSACSPYLEAILSQHYNQHPIVILKDVKFEELKAMLEYMYRGEVNVTQEQLGRFLKAAETLKIKGLTNSDVGCSTGQTAAIATPSASAVVAASVAASNPVPPPTPAPNMVGAGDAREMPIRTRQDHRKAVVQPVQTIQPRSPVMGNQTSLVETLKNAPASLVIDIPPISPVNSKEGSISPTPRKRRKRKQSQNDESVSNVENNLQQLNSDVHSSTISERSNESVVDVDPLAILETGLVKPEVKMECGDGNDDENDSEGELTMDEDYDASCSKAGPSNGASSAADCHAWQGAASDDGENAESSKETVMKETHSSEDDIYISGRFTCPQCYKSYTQRRNMIRHIRYECGVEPQFKCQYCSFKAKQKTNLKSHIWFKHANIKDSVEQKIRQLNSSSFTFL